MAKAPDPEFGRLNYPAGRVYPAGRRSKVVHVQFGTWRVDQHDPDIFIIDTYCNARYTVDRSQPEPWWPFRTVTGRRVCESCAIAAGTVALRDLLVAAGADFTWPPPADLTTAKLRELAHRLAAEAG